MTHETLSLLDSAIASTAYGSIDRVEAVEAVVYGAMYACNDGAMAYLWQAVYGLTDLEMRGALEEQCFKLCREISQYQADAV